MKDYKLRITQNKNTYEPQVEYNDEIIINSNFFEYLNKDLINLFIKISDEIASVNYKQGLKEGIELAKTINNKNNK